jgi:hypothetical protein
MQQQPTYKFKVLTSDCFEAEITVYFLNNLLKRIINISIKQLQKKGIDTSEFKEKDTYIINSVNIPPLYYKLVKNSFSNLFKSVSKEVQKDGVYPINFEITNCVYKKVNEKEWILTAFLSGAFLYKRVNNTS